MQSLVNLLKIRLLKNSVSISFLCAVTKTVTVSRQVTVIWSQL